MDTDGVLSIILNILFTSFKFAFASTQKTPIIVSLSDNGSLGTRNAKDANYSKSVR